MKVSDLFRVALKNELMIRGVSQKKLSDDLGINPILINNFLKKRKNFSEDRMEIISKYFNLTLFEMLTIGQELSSPPAKPKSDISIKVSDIAQKLEFMNQQDLKLINQMADRLIKK